MSTRSKKLASAVGAVLAATLLVSGCTSDDNSEPTSEQTLETAGEGGEESAAPKGEIDFSKVRGYDLSKLPDRSDPDAVGKFVVGTRFGYDPAFEGNNEQNIMQYLGNNRLVTNGFDMKETVYKGIEAEMDAYNGYFNVEEINKAQDDPVADSKNEVERQFTVTVNATGETKAEDKSEPDSDKIWNDGTWDGGTFTYVAYMHIIKADDNNWYVNSLEVVKS